ncbi:hypothetical protein [Deinococcus marmoris]|uniref:hypothetical protein n=1 Tax=Deinococcus marmoris TaxID=249408 RepID=UPI0004955DDB|nr:hypothetical protein [Deinococcus marmoris]
MTKTWTLEEAKAHFQQLVEAAQDEPQLIMQGDVPLVTVQRVRPAQPSASSALETIVGDFDWSDLPDEKLFERHPSPGRPTDQ